MAKNSKKSKAEATDGGAVASAPNEAREAGRPAVSETSARAKTSAAKAAGRARSGRKSSVASIRKAARGEKPKRRIASRKSAPPEVAVSNDEIRLRAYFISESRLQNGVAGDSAHDWLEARRQLQEEAKERA